MCALPLGRRHFAAGQGPGFKDPLEAKLRLAVGLLCGPMRFRMNIGRVRLFLFAHVDLIAAPIARLARRYCLQVPKVALDTLSINPHMPFGSGLLVVVTLVGVGKVDVISKFMMQTRSAPHCKADCEACTA